MLLRQLQNFKLGSQWRSNGMIGQIDHFVALLLCASDSFGGIPHSRQTKCPKRAITLNTLVKPFNAAKSTTSTSAVNPETQTSLPENGCTEPTPPAVVRIKQLYDGSVKPSVQDQALPSFFRMWNIVTTID